MEKNAKVEAIRHKSVDGKELMYISIETEKGKMFINVGKSNLENAETLTAIVEIAKGGKK